MTKSGSGPGRFLNPTRARGLVLRPPKEVPQMSIIFPQEDHAVCCNCLSPLLYSLFLWSWGAGQTANRS